MLIWHDIKQRVLCTAVYWKSINHESCHVLCRQKIMAFGCYYAPSNLTNWLSLETARTYVKLMYQSFNKVSFFEKEGVCGSLMMKNFILEFQTLHNFDSKLQQFRSVLSRQVTKSQ